MSHPEVLGSPVLSLFASFLLASLPFLTCAILQIAMTQTYHPPVRVGESDSRGSAGFLPVHLPIFPLSLFCHADIIGITNADSQYLLTAYPQLTPELPASYHSKQPDSHPSVSQIQCKVRKTRNLHSPRRSTERWTRARVRGLS